MNTDHQKAERCARLHDNINQFAREEAQLGILDPDDFSIALITIALLLNAQCMDGGQGPDSVEDTEDLELIADELSRLAQMGAMTAFGSLFEKRFGEAEVHKIIAETAKKRSADAYDRVVKHYNLEGEDQ